MTRPVVFCEPFCGTAAVTLRLLGGERAVSPVTYMGAKRRYAGAILAAMGLRSGQGADAVILNDAGPWARAWQILSMPGAALRVADGIVRMAGDGAGLFEQLRAAGQPADPIEWVASFLALQGAGALGIPVQACADGTWKTSGYAHVSKSGISRGFMERLRPKLLADRVACLDRIRWPRTEIYCTDALRLDAVALRASHVYADPPYAGTKGYGAEKMAQEDLAALAHRFAATGAVVAVSEGRPLEWPGWHAVDLTPCGSHGQVRAFTKSREEHMVINRQPSARPSVQLSLLAGRPA